ncbi:MAG: hypothetical protein Q9P01_04195 [Anaerolineae bacterium]|nr:hypothetical protein [Anaerolineae bacterium]MDQ7034044.1 hypothetical protein [Anaerolineae bacterium]
MKLKRARGNVYIPGLPMRLFMLSLGLLMAGIHAFVLRTADFGTSSGFPIFFLALILVVDAWMLWYGIIFTTQTHVHVTDDGIELQRGGARLFTTWQNISHFGVKGGGKNQQRGIFLHNKVKPQVNGLAEKLFYGWKTDFIPIGQVINIPTRWSFLRRSINLEKLAQTDFGYDVAQYAPHLLDEVDEKPKRSVDRLLNRSSDTTYVVGSDSRTLRKHKR